MLDEVTIDRARADDAEAFLKLQYLCYQSEAALYDDYTLPPLVEPLAGVQARLATERVLAARLGAEIVGSVAGKLRDDTCAVGRLIVHPRLQRRGLGARLMLALEAACPEARRFELFTGHLSASNLRLYARLGYREFRRQLVAPHLTLVYMEKAASPPPA